MALTLTVTSRHSQTLGPSSVRVFKGVGGSIGRVAGNDWVLPDPSKFVSGHHAVIEVVGSEYHLRDTSTNGTFVNGSEQPVGHGSSVPLHHGDRIMIGEYELAVTLTPDAPTYPPSQGFQQPTPPSLFGPDPGPQYQSAPAYPPTPSPWPPEPPPVYADPRTPVQQQPWEPLAPASASPDDPLVVMQQRQQGRVRTLPDALGSGTYAQRQPPDQGSWQQAGPLEDSFQPPVATPEPGRRGAAPIPDDWNKTTFPSPPGPTPNAQPMPPIFQYPPPPGPQQGQPPYYPQNLQQSPQQVPQPDRGGSGAWQPRQAPGPAPVPPAAARPGPAYQGGADPVVLRRILEVAGMDPASAQAAVANPQLADVLGQMLYILVQGMMEVLTARADIKETFRLQHTRMKPVENNPLKFCPDNRAVLMELFLPQGSGYMTPVGALQDGFDDIKAHQMAVMAGMKAAFDGLMKSFDPQALQEQFEGDKGGGLFKPLNKAKYWDNLTEFYAKQMRNPDESFRRLFGDSFAEAYEREMQRLTAMRRHR